MVHPSYEPAHATLRKYQLKEVGGWWKARVPYGTWNIFPTWEEGAAWLAEKHRIRERVKSAQRARRERVTD